MLEFDRPLEGRDDLQKEAIQTPQHESSSSEYAAFLQSRPCRDILRVLQECTQGAIIELSQMNLSTQAMEASRLQGQIAGSSVLVATITQRIPSEIKLNEQIKGEADND